MAHGDARKGKWRGNWQMEWVTSTLTLPRNMVYPALQPLIRTPLLPLVNWTDDPADLNRLVRFAERGNLVSAHVPSHFKHSLLHNIAQFICSDVLHMLFILRKTNIFIKVRKFRIFVNESNNFKNLIKRNNLQQFTSRWKIMIYYVM
jgi:hypothetical protein